MIYHPVLFLLSISHSSFTCRQDWWLSGPDFSGPPSSSSWWPSRCMLVTPESLITSTTGATCWWGCCREHSLLYSMWVSKTTSVKGNIAKLRMPTWYFHDIRYRMLVWMFSNSCKATNNLIMLRNVCCDPVSRYWAAETTVVVNIQKVWDFMLKIVLSSSALS